MRTLFIGGLGLVALLGSRIAAESQPSKNTSEPNRAESIPIEEIWGYELPGTNDIRQLEDLPDKLPIPNKELIRRSLILQIRQALTKTPVEGKKAGSAFVVTGAKQEALKNAHAYMTNKERKEPERFFPSDTDLTLVFFSYRYGRYVRIESVEQTEKLVTVKYRFVSHPETVSTVHFALIPLGKLSEGTVQVRIKQLPPVDKEGMEVTPVPNPSRYVCDSFTFRVQK